MIIKNRTKKVITLNNLTDKYNISLPEKIH